MYDCYDSDSFPFAAGHEITENESPLNRVKRACIYSYSSAHGPQHNTYVEDLEHKLFLGRGLLSQKSGVSSDSEGQNSKEICFVMLVVRLEALSEILVCLRLVDLH